MDRITPAHAGKRCSELLLVSRSRDHPRTRGEKAHHALGGDAVIGSPPHTRGKVGDDHVVHPHGGITPAHAGKRCAHLQPHRCGKDHPRTRGEKVPRWLTRCSWLGSPPHTRGKALPFAAVVGRGGITPAHAGKSSGIRCWWLHSGDHPRTRGEKAA